MADINVTQVTRSGVTLPDQITSTGADLTLPSNDGNVIVEVENPTGGSLTVTFVTTATVGGQALADLSVSISSGATRWIGPLPPALYNDAFGAVTVQAASGLKLRALRI